MATNPGTIFINGYYNVPKLNPDGTAGMDYFKNGQPVTREEFASNTGADVGQLEQQSALMLYNQNTQTGQSVLDNGYTSPTSYEMPPPTDNIPGVTNTTGSPTGDGGGTQTQTDIVSLNRVDYDLNNATDRQAFYQLKSSEIDKQLTQALSAGNMKYAGDLAKVQDQMTTYMKDWNKQGQDLLSGYSQGMTNRQQFFQGMGGRAYQSSMGTSGQNALNQLGEAQSERNYNKTQATNQNQQATNALEQSYNSWIGGAGQSAQRAKDELKTTQANIQGFKGPDVAAIGGQADMSAYSPTINFQQLQNSPMVAGQSTTPKPVSQMTLSEWLQQNQGKVKDPLQQYMMGKA